MPYQINKRKSTKERAKGMLSLGWRGTKVAAKGTVVTFPVLAWGGFLAFRLYVRKEVAKGLVEEYNYAPTIMGHAFYVALHGKMPSRKVTASEMKGLARLLSRQIVPIFSLKIPNKESIGKFVEARLKASNLGILLSSFSKMWAKIAGKRK